MYGRPTPAPFPHKAQLHHETHSLIVRNLEPKTYCSVHLLGYIPAPPLIALHQGHLPDSAQLFKTGTRCKSSLLDQRRNLKEGVPGKHAVSEEGLRCKDEAGTTQVREDTQKAATGSICMQINIWKKTNHNEPETLQDWLQKNKNTWRKAKSTNWILVTTAKTEHSPWK